MSKKNTLKKVSALFLSAALTVGATGCSFFVTDSELDLKQVVATVDITKTLSKADNELSDQATAVKQLIDQKVLTTDVYKRELVAYFISVGANYVNNYGYSYEQVFTILMKDLVNQKVLTQYAVAYYLDNGFVDEDGNKTQASVSACIDYVNKAIDDAVGIEKQLYSSNKTVLAMKYFLTEGGTNMDEYFETEYALKKSFNDALDSSEPSYIKDTDDDNEEAEEPRTLPTNVNQAEEDFVPMTTDGKLDYDVYTGRNALTSCGTYRKVDGSNVTSRKKAYNSFLASLQSYGLIGNEEDTAKFDQLNYYYTELATSLGKAVANKYLTSLQDQAIDSLKGNQDDNGDYDYAPVVNKYNEIYNAQKTSYTKTPANFETAIGALSDTAFSLYGYEDFGFVYNILLPFNAEQEAQYEAWKSKGLSDEQLFAKRKALLADVQAKDLRGTWFSTDKNAHYAYAVTQGNANSSFYGDAGDGYLFFEDHFKGDKQYKALGQYVGKYAYNGTVVKNDDHEWEVKPNKLGINAFIEEMNEYINFAVTGDANSGTATGSYLDAYNENYVDKNGDVQYKNFIYYEGKLNGVTFDRSNYFNKETDFYKAVSAVNELMFAYSTDPGALNTYLGYAVSPYKTSFVPEFETAAQYAIQKGAGTYVVAPSDYGWHIIFVTFAYNNADDTPFNGDVYGGFNVADVDTEGTFSNLFYEAIKSTSVTNYTAEKQTLILKEFDESATLFTKRYQDLLDLGK